MSNGLNFNSILNVGMFAAGFFTGGATWAALGQQLLSQVATQAFSSALDQLGVGGPLKDLALNAFSEGAAGSADGAGIFDQELLDTVRNAANHQGADGQYTGELDRAQQDLAKDITQFLAESYGRKDAEGSGGSDSWLVAMAKAMGRMAGDKAQKMKDLSTKLEGLDQDAKEYNETLFELQGSSQEYNLMTSAFSQVIKSVGEGLAQLARKQ
jgi:hypothetical protein